MNPHTLALRYLGWCPGVNSVARWIPEKEYPDRQLFVYSMIGLTVILGLSYYSFARKPPSYSWDIGFSDAVYDNFSDMYMVQKTASLNGVYNISIWVDLTTGEHCLIRWINRGPTWDEINQEWIITEGIIETKPDKYNTYINQTWTAQGSSIWEVSSSSRQQVVHIRIVYIKSRPVWG